MKKFIFLLFLIVGINLNSNFVLAGATASCPTGKILCGPGLCCDACCTTNSFCCKEDPVSCATSTPIPPDVLCDPNNCIGFCQLMGIAGMCDDGSGTCNCDLGSTTPTPTPTSNIDSLL